MKMWDRDTCRKNPEITCFSLWVFGNSSNTGKCTVNMEVKCNETEENTST